MRDLIVSDTGRSGLIARHRLVEQLPYFLSSDRDWTKEHLISPLLTEGAASLVLWRAVARQTRYTDVLKIIGDAMADKATDSRLERTTRQSLVFSIIVESLDAFRVTREPAVTNSRVQQMLRSLDDEVRASAADTVQKFIRDHSQNQTRKNAAEYAAELALSTAVPFLRDIWPQEAVP